MTYLLVKFNEKVFAFETELSYLGPIERVHLGVILEDEYSIVYDCQIEGHTIVILDRR